jgi:KUP system potassium uptake protein
LHAEAAQGGYVPLALAGAVYLIMWIWHRGAAAVAARIHEDLIPIDTFMAKLERDRVPRVPGTAVLAITTQIETVPWIADEKRATVAQEAPGFWRASMRYGFMERPDTPRLLAQLKERGCTIDLADVTYYVGHETVTRRQDGGGLPGWQEELFAFMERNAAHVTDYFNLPGN